MKKIEKISYERLWINVTRKCNLNCKHCYCGKAQNVDISKEVIDRLAETTSYINHLYLTGGEISLCVDKIEYLLEAMKRNHVPIYGIRFQTNAAEKSERLCSVINKFTEYVKVKGCDNEPCKIFISTDHIHRENIPDLDENIAFYQERCNYFYRLNDNADKKILYIGNAEENYSLEDENVKPRHMLIEQIKYSDEHHILSDHIVLDVGGKLYVNDIPYKMRDTGEYEIANIMIDNIIDQIDKYNNSVNVRILDPVFKAWHETNELDSAMFEFTNNTDFLSEERAEQLLNNFNEQIEKLKGRKCELDNDLAIKEYDLLLNEFNSNRMKEFHTAVKTLWEYTNDSISETNRNIRLRYSYLDKEFLEAAYDSVKGLVFDKCKLKLNTIKNLSKEDRSESEKNIEEIETTFMLAFAKRNEEQYENQFTDHEKTHKKYPQFTPKDCIVWDNSMKCLTDKRGVAWKDKTIRQRHIDIIDKMKKNKLSDREARLVRIP